MCIRVICKRFRAESGKWQHTLRSAEAMANFSSLLVALTARGTVVPACARAELRRYSGVDVTRYSSVTALQLIQHVFHRTRRGQ